MKLEDVKKLTAQQKLVYWIKERESIRLKKEAKAPKPWTDDRILQSYRFCNVRRMDDKVSRWLEINWYKPHFDHPNMLLACVIARNFNLIKTLDKITSAVFDEGYQALRIQNTIEALKDCGHTVFNAAYIIRASKDYPNKVAMVLGETVQQLVDDPPELDTSSIQHSVNHLMTYRNFGGFMAGQVIADMRWAVTGEWSDRNDWAVMGPGSKRGMNRLHGRPIEYPINEVGFTDKLQAMMVWLKRELPASITSRLEAIDYQNCLCELDKYCRTLGGEGKPKQLYPGKG